MDLYFNGVLGFRNKSQHFFSRNLEHIKLLVLVSDASVTDILISLLRLSHTLPGVPAPAESSLKA